MQAAFDGRAALLASNSPQTIESHRVLGSWSRPADLSGFNEGINSGHALDTKLGYPRRMAPALTSTARIIVVDDDDSVRDALLEYLSGRGYGVRAAAHAPAFDALWAAERAELVIVDVMMPGEDGLSLCRRLAPLGVPILMLSALDGVTDRVVGLETGAWDYLSKPFEPAELLARVRALLRRPGSGGAAARGQEEVTFAGWWLDVAQRRLRDPAGRPLSLTASEHALLAVFVERPGRVLSRDALLDAARGL
ncbi:MAG TPA: response regulator, partial [Allosphingosinicella sp.]